MFATAAKLLIFVACIALLTEITLRLYYFGPDGLSPQRLNSYRVILDSDIVQPADNTAIYYELKPGLDTIYHGKPFATNSQGLADRAYAMRKPEGTYRIAIAGSSWSMATGVGSDEPYHALLEEKLAAHWPERNVEIINFGVEYYGLGEITATIRDKILAYDPDMIMLAVTSTTPTIAWDDDKAPFIKQEIVPPFWQSYMLAKLAWLLGNPDLYAKSTRPAVTPNQGYASRNITRAMVAAEDIERDRDIDIVVLSLTHTKSNEAARKHITNASTKRGLKIIHLHLDDLASNANTDDDFLTDKFSLHPNPLGHELIADEIFRALWATEPISGDQQ